MMRPQIRIAHIYSENIRPYDQVETLRALHKLRWEGYIVLDFPIFRDKDEPGIYGSVLKRLWAMPFDFIICEMDIVPTKEAIDSLIQCDELACCCPYLLSDRKQLSVFNYEPDTLPGNLKIVQAKGDHCELSGFGLTKITRRFRNLVFFNPKDEADSLDGKLSFEMRKIGLKYHIHYIEVKHNHYSTLEDSAQLKVA